MFWMVFKLIQKQLNTLAYVVKTGAYPACRGPQLVKTCSCDHAVTMSPLLGGWLVAQHNPNLELPCASHARTHRPMASATRKKQGSPVKLISLPLAGRAGCGPSQAGHDQQVRLMRCCANQRPGLSMMGPLVAQACWSAVLKEPSWRDSCWAVMTSKSE